MSFAGKILSIGLLTLSLVLHGNTVDRKINVGDKPVMTVSPAGAEIVISADAPQTLKFALKELNGLLGQVFGKELPVVNTPTAGKVSIVLGDNPLSRAAGLDTSKLPPDGYYIKTVGNKVFIVGTDDPKESPEKMLVRGGAWSHFYDRGTLCGVYDFLERAAGIRFYFAGSLGTVVPKADKLEIPAYDITERPDFISRTVSNFWDGTWYEGENRDAVINPAKNLNSYRLRLSCRQELCCHGLSRLNYLKRFGKSNPEYFALTEAGWRYNDPAMPHPGQLCLSSGIREEIYQDVKAILSEDVSQRDGLDKAEQWRTRKTCPGYVDIMPQDSFVPCQCDKCKATYGTGKYFASDLIWKFTAEIGFRLKKEGVKGDLQQMAYRPYRAVPEFELPDNIRVTVAERGPWLDAYPEAQKIEDGEVIAWYKKLNRKVRLWNYANRVGGIRIKGVPSITPHAVGAYYKRIAPYANGVFMESESENFMYNHLNYYIFSKVTWNAQCDYKAMIEEYYQKMFGPAAGIMKKIFEDCEKLWLEKIGGRTVDSNIGPRAVPPSNYEIWNKIYTPQVIDAIQKELDKAENITSGIERERVKLMRREVFDKLVKAANDYIAHTSVVKGLRYCAGTDSNVKPLKLSVWNGKNRTAVDTEVKVWFADNNMHIKFDCEEPFFDKMTAVKRKRDDFDIWKDNVVEVWINPDGKRKDVYHIQVNTAGSVSDCYYIYKSGNNQWAWESEVQTKLERTSRGFTLEMVIPESKFPKLDKNGFVADFARARVLKGITDIEPYYNWSRFVSGFGDLENFGLVTVGDKSLIYNGDFSKLVSENSRHWGKNEGSKWLEGWIGGTEPGSNTMDKKVYFSAPQSLKLHSVDPKQGACVTYFYLHSLKPNTKYRLSCMIKSENVQGTGGVCMIVWDKANRWFPQHNSIRGTSDWSFQSFEFVSDPTTNTTKAKAFVSLRILNATGTAWFDDVRLEEIP